MIAGFAPSFSVEVGNVLVAPDVSASITELSVTRQPGAIGECSLTLANPLPDMRWTHAGRDADVFAIGNWLTVKLGYGSTLQTVFDGCITKIAAAFPDSGSPTLRVDGQTRMYELAKGSNTRTFRDVTDKDIAAQIAKDLKLQLEADDHPTRYAYVVQAGQSDLAFLLERASRILFEVSVEGSTLYFTKVGGKKLPEPTLVYGSTDAPHVPADALPLRSFSPTMNPTKAVTEVVVRGQHPVTREPIEGRASEADATATLKGETKGSTITKMLNPMAQELGTLMVVGDEEATTWAAALYTRAALEFVTGSGATVGMPEMVAGQTVKLLGLGLFSGRYYVTQVTHAMGSSGFTTSFQVRTDSLDGPASKPEEPKP
jgi:uncharacterized protein